MMSFTRVQHTSSRIYAILFIVTAFLATTSLVEALPLATRGIPFSKSAKCPDVDDIVKMVHGKGGANSVYWSWPGSPSNAKAYARKVGGASIYDVITNDDIAKWGRLCSPEEKAVLWKRASFAFALRSSGTAYVLTSSEKPTPVGSVWSDLEYPALKANGKIDRIMVVDSTTGVVTTLWVRVPNRKYPMPAKL